MWAGVGCGILAWCLAQGKLSETVSSGSGVVLVHIASSLWASIFWSAKWVIRTLANSKRSHIGKASAQAWSVAGMLGIHGSRSSQVTGRVPYTPGTARPNATEDRAWSLPCDRLGGFLTPSGCQAPDGCWATSQEQHLPNPHSTSVQHLA